METHVEDLRPKNFVLFCFMFFELRPPLLFVDTHPGVRLCHQKITLPIREDNDVDKDHFQVNSEAKPQPGKE